MLFEKSEYDYRLENGDTFSLIKKEKDNSLDLIITSPPYNIGKEYETKVGLTEYLEQYKAFAEDAFNKLKDSGSLCWQVGNFIDKGEVYPLDIYFYDVFKSAGFQLRNRIIRHFEHGLHAKNRLSGRYETVLWFTKSDKYKFNLDAIRVPSKYPGKLHYKGAKKGQPSGNPLGKNPSDFWKTIENDWDKQIRDIPNVKSNHPEKTIHPCQFPIELIQRCVLALTDEGDSVLDPFMGVGSTVLASLMHNRIGVGYDLMKEYIDCTKNRITELQQGTLKFRPLGKPVYQPTGKEKSCLIPTQWKYNIYQ